MIDEDRNLGKRTSAQEHMANERTFLAWIRTSIALMAFGFVVQRFAFFLENFSLIARINGSEGAGVPEEYSTYWGIIMVGFGAFISLFGYLRYRKVGRQINDGTYHQIGVLDLLLACFVVAIGISLIIYLLNKM